MQAEWVAETEGGVGILTCSELALPDNYLRARDGWLSPLSITDLANGQEDPDISFVYASP